MLICLTALATSVATAGAASLITGSDVKDGSLTGADIKKNSVPLDRLAGGSTDGKLAKSGPANYGGDDDHGDRGHDPRGGEHWGIIARNTIGSSVGDGRNGPFVSPPGAGDSPPFGDGSVGLETKDGTEKVAYGNEVDFFGDKVADLDEVGFHVFQTGENQSPANGGPTNMPNIAFEVDPTGFNDNTAPNYTTMTWNPPPVAPSEVNRWSGYKDATTTGLWGLTGGFYNSPATAANCGLNGPRCSFAAVKAVLGPNAQILSAAVAKGRDHPWVGAVDGLRINNSVFDFEITGVRTRRAW